MDGKCCWWKHYMTSCLPFWWKIKYRPSFWWSCWSISEELVKQCRSETLVWWGSLTKCHSGKKGEEEEAVSPVVIKILPCSHNLHSFIQFTNCFVPNLLVKSQITFLHYTSNFTFFTWEKAQCTKINVRINLWHIREAISKLFPLQLTPIHVHFTKEVVLMSQSSWYCIQKCCFPRSFQTK